jgi:hypothetical protein
MLWCFIPFAISCAALGLAVLWGHPPRLRLPQITPIQLLRGCLGGTLLLIAGLFTVLIVVSLR